MKQQQQEKKQTLSEEVNSLYTIKRRSVSLMVIFCVFFVAISARLAYIQFSWGDELFDKAVTQWAREFAIAPKRGTIYDTNGLVLAASVTRYSLQATPNDIENPEAVATLLSPILNMTVDELTAKIGNTSQALVWVKRLLTEEQSSQIRNLGIKGLDLLDEPARVYPYNNLAAQVLGFVMKYADTSGHAGQSGIELYYNESLIGEPGTIQRVTDNIGQEISGGQEIRVEALDGSNIILTIDTTLQGYLQEEAYKAMQKFQADGVYAVASNPNTGEIYAMVNLPDYDPNEPPRELSLTELMALTKNMTCQMNYDPGSTFKPFVLAAAVEENAINYYNDQFYCPGYKIVDGVTIHCSNRDGHSTQSAQGGLNHSCNPVFMSIGEKLGKDALYEYIDAFGFGQKTGIDVAGEEAGIVMDKEDAVLVDWMTMCFGQAISVTAIQMMTAFNSLINGGYIVEPYLLKEINRTTEDVNGKQNTDILYSAKTNVVRQVISKETSDLMRKALEGTVSGGSAQTAKIPGYLIGGKTGTAQTYDESGHIALGVDIASFIAYGPYENPEISVYLLVYNPKGQSFGSLVAAPYVGAFLEKAFYYLGTKPTEEIPINKKTPDVTGLEVEDAVAALEAKFFDIYFEGSGNVIVAQSIPKNKWVSAGTKIVLTLAQVTIDPTLVKVPYLTGLSKEAAQRTLVLNGLDCIFTNEGDIVDTQSLLPGTFVEKGTKITCTLKSS